MIEHSEIPISVCPVCYYKMDCATASSKEGRRRPIKGDLSVCLKCGTGTAFDENLSMVALTEEELEKIKVENMEAFSQLREVQSFIASMRKQN